MAWLLIFPLVWIAAVSGRQLNHLVCPMLGTGEITPSDRTAFGLATGYVLVAYGVLALGLIGRLTPLPVATWCIALALTGYQENLALAKEIARGFGGTKKFRLRDWIFVFVVIFVTVIAAIGCFSSPISSEWDSLSYHLADPKIFVRAHRISYLPWESHSNFAFNMEMLYSIGMMAKSIALAKLLQLVISAAGVVAVYSVARRLLSLDAARAATLIYITLPVVMWEAGTAYVDLAATSYATLALLALILLFETGNYSWIFIAGLILGGMLGIKATALVTLFLYAIGLVAYRAISKQGIAKGFRQAFIMGSTAIVVGCPWYIKSWFFTGNPFYPFAYGIFGGRYWNSANSVAYSADQNSFGLGHRAFDLLLVPWNLIMYLAPGHLPPAGAVRPFNDYQTFAAALSPLFLILGLVALLVPLKPKPPIRILALYAIADLVIWFFLTQQVRYLMPLVPVLCILSAWVVARSTEYHKGLGLFLRWTTYLTTGIGMCMLLPLTGLQLSSLMDSQSRENYISRGLETYDAAKFINSSTLPGKVVCYGEPRGFYLDRDYIWGEPGHSLYIPYDTLKTGDSLRQYLVARGYRLVLINQRYAQFQPGQGGWPNMVYQMTFGSSQPIYADDRRGVYVFSL